MNDSDNKLKEKVEANRELIRQEFGFLTTEYGYLEDFNLTEDNIYSQVLYAKNNWRISITTISYDRRLSLRLLSPKEQSGFLDYYFSFLDKNYDRNIKSVSTLDKDIKYKSNFLRTNAQAILVANPLQLNEVLDITINGHNIWIKENNLKQND